MRTIIASLTILPIGTESTSLSHHVAEAVKALRKRGIKFQLGPTSTSLEVDSFDEILKSVEAIHDALSKRGVRRIVTFVTIDDRRDVKRRSLEEMVDVIEKRLGSEDV